jgi:hypothetical protein
MGECRTIDQTIESADYSERKFYLSGDSNPSNEANSNREDAHYRADGDSSDGRNARRCPDHGLDVIRRVVYRANLVPLRERVSNSSCSDLSQRCDYFSLTHRIWNRMHKYLFV